VGIEQPVLRREPHRGDLVRWVTDYMLYAADDKGNAWPHNPVYEYGIVMEVSHVDPFAVIIFGMNSKTLFVANTKEEEIETVSAAQRGLLYPTTEEIKKYEK